MRPDHRKFAAVPSPKVAGRGGLGEAPLSPRPLETHTITLIGARGGQGTTTLACALAVLSAAHQPTTLATTDPRGAATVLGLARTTETPAEVVSGLRLDTTPGATGITIVDDGRIGDVPVHHPGPRYAVLRGPCYVSMASLLDHVGGFDGIILVVEEGRSLNAHDVSDVLDVPVVATVTATPTVARAIDAGLLISRVHRLPDLAGLRHLVRPTARASHAPLMKHTDLQLPKNGNFSTARACRDHPSHWHVCGVWREAKDRHAEHRKVEPRGRRVLHR